eukprot:1137071-Pelagomonas_calceolata.AAC.3
MNCIAYLWLRDLREPAASWEASQDSAYILPLLLCIRRANQPSTSSGHLECGLMMMMMMMMLRQRMTLSAHVRNDDTMMMVVRLRMTLCICIMCTMMMAMTAMRLK